MKRIPGEDAAMSRGGITRRQLFEIGGAGGLAVVLSGCDVLSGDDSGLPQEDPAYDLENAHYGPELAIGEEIIVANGTVAYKMSSPFLLDTRTAVFRPLQLEEDGPEYFMLVDRDGTMRTVEIVSELNPELVPSDVSVSRSRATIAGRTDVVEGSDLRDSFASIDSASVGLGPIAVETFTPRRALELGAVAIHFNVPDGQTPDEFIQNNI